MGSGGEGILRCLNKEVMCLGLSGVKLIWLDYERQTEGRKMDSEKPADAPREDDSDFPG